MSKLRPIPFMAATLYYEDENVKPRVYLGSFKPYFCKVDLKRPIRIYFSLLHISPGGYPVMEVLDKHTKEHYMDWFKMFEYRIHPIKGVFEFETEEIENILKGIE